MNDFTVRHTDLDGFLDELCHRGPNVEPVVRVSEGTDRDHLFDYLTVNASYLRAYGDKIATITLRLEVDKRPHPFPMLFPPRPGEATFFEDPQPGRDEEYRRLIDDLERQRAAQIAERRADANARIGVVARESGIVVAGGEVAVAAPQPGGDGQAGQPQRAMEAEGR